MRILSFAWATAVAAVLVGCATRPASSDGLPSDRYLVGGGFQITYVAPSDGTAIWANKANGQILATQSLKAGEVFEMSGDPSDQTGKMLLGEDPSQARLVLYFQPVAPDEGS